MSRKIEPRTPLTSGSSGGAKDKTMSSRLLTMKFMQRGAASSPSSPSPSSSHNPPASKRQRTDSSSSALRDNDTNNRYSSLAVENNSSPHSPTPQPLLNATGPVFSPSDFQRAAAQQRQREAEASERRIAEYGDGRETRWVLNFAPASAPNGGKSRVKGMKVIAKGMGEIDTARTRNGHAGSSDGDDEEKEEEEEVNGMAGRRSYGSFAAAAAGTAQKRKLGDGGADGGESDDGSQDESEDDKAGRRRGEGEGGKKYRQSGKPQPSGKEKKERRQAPVDLEGLSSISGGGGGGGGGGACHRCGSTRHQIKDCPLRSSGGGYGRQTGGGGRR